MVLIENKVTHLKVAYQCVTNGLLQTCTTCTGYNIAVVTNL